MTTAHCPEQAGRDEEVTIVVNQWLQVVVPIVAVAVVKVVEQSVAYCFGIWGEGNDHIQE